MLLPSHHANKMADIVGDVVIYKRKTYEIHTRLYSGVKKTKTNDTLNEGKEAE